VSICEAARRLGVSQPTFRKWIIMTLENGNSIAGLYFIRENNINADSEID
jgi:transposase-like protein